jgi:hypothetical protein
VRSQIGCAKADSNWQEQLASLMRRAPGKILIGDVHLHPDQGSLRASVKELKGREGRDDSIVTV